MATTKSIFDEMTTREPSVLSGAPQSIISGILGPKTAPPVSPELPPDPQDIDVSTGAPPIERALSSFYGSPQGKQFVLSKKFGQENTRIRDGKAEFINPSTGKWTALDEKGLTGRDLIDFVGDLPEIILGTALEIGGGLAGTAVGGGPPGGVAGSVAGAGFGQVTGAGIKRLIQKLIGPVEEFKPLEEFALGAGTELVGRGIAAGAKKLLKPRTIEPLIADAARAAESAGVPLTIAQKTGSPFAAGSQNFIERLPFSDRSSGITRQGVAEFGKFVEEELVDEFGRDISKRQAGDLISAAFSKRIKALRIVAKNTYDEVWNAAGGTGVAAAIVPENLIKVAGEIRQEIERGAVKDEGVERFLRFLSEDPIILEGRTLQEMAEIRSSILNAGRDITKTFSKGKRFLAQLNSAAEKDIDAWGGAFSTDIVKQLKDANNLYRNEVGILFNPKLGNLVSRTEAGKVVSESIPGRIFGKDASTKPRVVRRIVGEDVWGQLQGFVAHDLVQKSMVKGPGDVSIISPFKLKKEIGKISKDELNAIFSSRQQEVLRNFSKIGSLFPSAPSAAFGGNPSGTGQALVKQGVFKDVLAALGFGAGAFAGAQSPGLVAAGLAAGPITSKILQSDTMAKYLSDGFLDLRPSAQKALTNAARAALITIINANIRKPKLKDTVSPVPSPGLRVL